MVYIHLNQKILTLLPKYLPKSITPLVLENKKYLNYKDFKQVTKKLKIQLHKFIIRSDIIPESQINHKIQLSRRTSLEKNVIEQLKSRQQYKKNNPSLSDQISFLCKEAIYQANHEKLSEQVYSAGKMIFGMCMSSIMGYLIAQNGFGLDPLWSLCISGLSAGGVYFCTALGNVGRSQKKGSSQAHIVKKSRKSKESSASIQFGQGADNLATTNSKGKLKRR